MADWDIRPSDPEPEVAPPTREPSGEATIHRCRRIAKALRVIAVVTFAIGLVAQFGFSFTNDERFGFGEDTPFSYELYQFLQGMIYPLAYGALVFGAAAVVDIMAARLAADLSLDGGATAKRRPAADGDLVVKTPPRSAQSQNSHATNVDDAIWKPPQSVE